MLPGTNKALLFGGLSMGTHKGYYNNSRFCQTCKDGRFYILDTDTYEWQHIKVPLIQPRAYHSVTVMEKDDEFVAALIGGVVYEETAPTHREALNEIVVLTIDKEIQNFSLKEVSLQPSMPTTHNVFLSSHATTVHNNVIIVAGGVQDQKKEMKEKSRKASSTVYSIDLGAKVFEAFPATCNASETFSTHGHSIHHLASDTDNTFLVLGGSSRQISLLTDRSFEPESCDSEPCTIASSGDKVDPTWIQCNRKCQKWFHIHCIKLTRIPEGDYHCKKCKK